MGYPFSMGFAEVLAELPSLPVSERQLLVCKALDLDEPAFSETDEAEVERRMEAHRRNPDSAVPLEEMKTRVRSRLMK
jgi:putative addiction module component (TIGR02574 family)